MSDHRNPFNYPLNPDFGKGIYRRRIRLQHINDAVRGRYVHGDLEDNNHGFSVTLFHDGKVVTDITGQHHRIPFTTCGGAIEPLKNMIGKPLSLNSFELSNDMNPRANCTHWLDLAMLAFQHALREEPVRDYLIEVPDETTSTRAKVFCNSTLMHEWVLQDWIIQEPAALQGNTIFKGFSAWANQAYSSNDLREAAFMLQKGYFVSRARRFDVNGLAGERATTDHIMHGACFTYSAPQLNDAVRTKGTLRDFTNTPEELLLFK